MLLRRTSPLALAIAALACEPSVPYNAANNPSRVDYAGFDPTGTPPATAPSIPLPNDLALQPQAIATQPPAQQALLAQWAADKCFGGMQGCFPNDQEVPITIDFVSESIDTKTGAATRSAPQLDVTTINTSTLTVLALGTLSSTAVKYDQPVASPCDPTQVSCYVVNGDHGTLTLHKSADPNNGGSRRWPANSLIIVAVRGQANGVKVVSGAPGGLQPQPAMYLLLQDTDLTLPQNQGIIPGATRADKAATAAQLEQIRKSYQGPFGAIDAVWGPGAHHELATMGTFKVADTAKKTHVETDPSAGRMPLPSDFLMGPNGHLLPQLASASGPFGPLGPGLATLDGFSTTAMVLSQTSTYIQANTVPGGVFIFEVNASTTPPSFKRLADVTELAQGKSPGYAAEPPPITQDAVTKGACATPPPATCLSNAIGLQPGVPAPVPPAVSATGVLPLPPLKEATTYVVLVTDKVLDLNGDPLTRSTLGKLLFLDPTITIASGGKSTVSGVSDTQAVGLDQMRLAINGAAQTLLAEKTSLTYADLVMGYTFKTQSITAVATNLAALPYANPTALLSPPAGTTPTVYCGGSAAGGPACTAAVAVTDAFNAYGTDPTVAPNTDIGYIVDTKITTFNKLLCNPGDATCQDTGAFSPATVNPVLENIPALIALPQPGVSFPGGCIPGPGPANGGVGPGNSPNGVCTLPLIVFHHGLGGGRADMLSVADEFTKAGFAVAAIDADKHGDRAYCDAGAPSTPAPQCAIGATCVPDATLAGEGDPAAHVPGHCMNGSAAADFFRRPKPASCTTCTNTKAIPIASGNYFVSANLFRTRDTLRQDIIDQSQLLRVLSPNPGCTKTAPPTDAVHTCANNVITGLTGVQIDPNKIYFVGVSLGSIEGTVDVAANPRFSRAAFSVGGSTLTDIFTNSPAFTTSVTALLASIGITPGTPAYLQFINVAKWVIDPADPENFALHLTANTLPSPLLGGAAPPAKQVIGQFALCDDTVPNPFNLNLYGLIGLGPVSASQSTRTLFATGTPTATPSCPANAAHHGFLLDWKTYGQGSTSLTLVGQSDITGFFADTPALPLPAHFQ